MVAKAHFIGSRGGTGILDVTFGAGNKVNYILGGAKNFLLNFISYSCG